MGHSGGEKNVTIKDPNNPDLKFTGTGKNALGAFDDARSRAESFYSYRDGVFARAAEDDARANGTPAAGLNAARAGDFTDGWMRQRREIEQKEKLNSIVKRKLGA